MLKMDMDAIIFKHIYDTQAVSAMTDAKSSIVLSQQLQVN